MKLPVSVALLSVFALAACVDEPPPQPRRPAATRYPAPTPAAQYPPPPQPFDTAPPQEVVTTPPQDPIVSAPPPTNPPPSTTAKGDYPYGVPVPGKPGFVRSPYSPDKMTDVRGYAPGTEVKDPYTQKIFLVP